MLTKGIFLAIILVQYIAIHPTLFVTANNHSANISDSTALRNHLIGKNDHRFRPINNQSAPIQVNFEFHLYQILAIDEPGMKMTVTCGFLFSWVDEIRFWNLGTYGGIMVIHPDPIDVWRPRIFFVNSVSDQDVFKDDYAHLSVTWAGLTRWEPGIILQTSCALNLKFYPYDEQTCNIRAKTSYFSSEVEFFKSTNSAIIHHYTPNGEWTLLKTEIATKIEGEKGAGFSFVKISIYLRRNPAFFFINSLFPTMMLSILSLMVFVLPRNSGERAGYCMTVLLSLSLIQSSVSSQLPQTPQTFPYIVMYLFTLFILSWMMMVSTILILVWRNRQEKKSKLARNDISDSSEANTKLLTSLDDNLFRLEAGFISDGNMGKDPMRDLYDPLGPNVNENENQQVNRRKSLFPRRDLTKVHPADPRTETFPKISNTPVRYLCSRPEAVLNAITSDLDRTLFCTFLSLWILASLLYLLAMILG